MIKIKTSYWCFIDEVKHAAIINMLGVIKIDGGIEIIITKNIYLNQLAAI